METLKKIDWKPALAVAKALGACALVLACYIAVNVAAVQALPDGTDAVTITLVANAVTCLGIIGAAVALLAMKRRTPFHIDEPRPLAHPAPKHLLILVATLWLVWSVGQTSLVWILEQGLGSDFVKQQKALSTAPVQLVLLALLVAAPVTEELLMRGVVYPRLRKAMGYMPAAIVSAALFAAMHGTSAHLVYTVSLGVLLAISYELTRMIWVPMLLHLLFNLGALVPPSVFQPFADKWVVMIGNMVVVVVLANLVDVVRSQDGTADGGGQT